MIKYEEGDQFEYTFKGNKCIIYLLVLLIGDASVGKTFLLNRYIKEKLPKRTGPTIGVEFATKIVALKNNVFIKAQVWDTAGQEKYKAMTAA